jgi:phosphatidate cytidylyltransferase
MLHWRLLFGTIIIAALAGLCWLDHLALLPGAWLMPLALVFVFVASAELVQLMRSAGAAPRAWIVNCGNVLIVLASWLPVLLTRWELWETPLGGGLSWQQAMALTAWPLAAFTICTLVVFINEMCIFRQPGQAIANMASSLFALAYLGLLVSFLVQLRLAWGVAALVTLIIVVKVGDTGAYFTGRLIGRHKLTPVISPGKTVEGAIGAVFFACLSAWLCWKYLMPLMITPEAVSQPCWYDKLLVLITGQQSNAACCPTWSHWAWLPYGIFVSIAGIFGDLAESLIKRDACCKDSSAWMPGFGGVLDLLDSLLFAAPIGWLFCMFR